MHFKQNVTDLEKLVSPYDHFSETECNSCHDFRDLLLGKSRKLDIRKTAKSSSLRQRIFTKL
jgi:hypothetical protein